MDFVKKSTKSRLNGIIKNPIVGLEWNFRFHVAILDADVKEKKLPILLPEALNPHFHWLSGFN